MKSDFIVVVAVVLIFSTITGFALLTYSRKIDDPCITKGGTVIKTPYGTVCAKLEIIK